MAIKFVPAHVNESTESVDNLGGILSMVLVGSLVMAINFAPVPNMGTLALSLAAVAIVALVLFIIRQRRAKNPLYDLKIAGSSYLLGGGGRRHHRLRLADGGDVYRPAIPTECARLLDRKRRCRHSAGGALHDSRGAPFSQTRAGARITLYLAAQLCRRLNRLCAHAGVVE